MRELQKALVLAVAIAGLSLISTGCHKSESDTTSSDKSSTSKPTASPLVGFAKDLQYIKNGQYTYIYVLSRKDGKPFQPDDKDFLNKNAPQIVDRVLTDDKMKAIAGTNFNLEEGNMAVLKKRYVVEDYSGR